MASHPITLGYPPVSFRQAVMNFAYILSRLRGWPIVLKTSESIWCKFAFICYVSIHLEISAAVLFSAVPVSVAHDVKGKR
jgi:hypothetical protein